MKKTARFQILKPVRDCGGCTACCTALMIEELDKPPLATCAHVAIRGCGIYAERPASCRNFECGWKFDLPGLGLLEEDRPDKSGVVVFLANPGMQAISVHAARAEALETSEAQAAIGRMAAKGNAFVVIEGAQVKGVYAPPGGHPLVERVQALIAAEAAAGA